MYARSFNEQAPGGAKAPTYGPRFDPAQTVKWALGIWRSALDARHATLTAQWCAANGLVLPDCVDDGVLRFHSRLSFGDVRVPGLLWLLTDIKSTEPVGILRYFLADDGTVIGKRILGRGFGMAIRLSPDEEVEQGLHIAANSEVGLRAMMDGLRPVWAVTNASAATAFPPLASLEVTGHRRAKGTAALTITPERQYIILYRLNEGCP